MAKSGAALKSIHAKSIKALAWTTLVFALAVSAMLPQTFVGDWTRKLLAQIPPPWGAIVSIIAFLFLVVIALVDIYVDWEPNRASIYCVLMLGCVATTLGGGLASWVMQLSNGALHMVDQWLFKAAPPGLGSSALAVAAAIAVVLMANRVVSKKSRKG